MLKNWQAVKYFIAACAVQISTYLEVDRWDRQFIYNNYMTAQG